MIALPKGVNATKVKGRPYYYYHPGRGTATPGKPVRLPDDPSSLEFWRIYCSLSGAPMPLDLRPAPPSIGTFAALIAAYKAAPAYQNLAEQTRKLYDHHLAIIADIWGERQVRGVRPAHVLALQEAFAATPRKADHLVSMLSTIIGWGVPREFAGTNPCREIKKISGGDGWLPWQQEDIDYARANLRADLWWAAALALYTGQRQSDVLAMSWDRVASGEVSVKQEKTGKFLRIPLHRDLRAVLADVPRTSVRILTNSRGLPWASGFKAAWQDAMNAAAFAGFRERRLVFHGLRKSAVVMLLEAGCTDAEVAAITGQSRDMIAHYSLMVNQRKLARAAILKWEAGNSG